MGCALRRVCDLAQPREAILQKPEHSDVLILGSGQGGKLLAWHLAKSGKSVVVVERRWVGGACPAVACMPSKNEIWSATVAHTVQQAPHFGTFVQGAELNMRSVRGRKQDMIDREQIAHLREYAKSGATLVMGEGRFVADRILEVELNEGGLQRLTADEIVINVGTHATVPDLPGLREARPLTHIEALELDYVPAHLMVLGGGYVGLELAQAFRRFGSRVTVIEPGPRILSREDSDVSAEMQRLLMGEGVEILTNMVPESMDGVSGEQVTLMCRTADSRCQVSSSDVLVASGRTPNTRGIGLDQLGVNLDERGFIEVDNHLRTTASDVWAIGECAGSPQFTHVSVDDFRIVRDNMAGLKRSTQDRLIPYVVFTDPPLARIGLSEEEARRRGAAVRVSNLPMAHVLRTEATDQKEGWMKTVVDEHSDQILGFTMIGAEAGEVLAAVQTAMLCGASYTCLRDAVFAHLTFAEGLGPLFAGISAIKEGIDKRDEVRQPSPI